MQSRKITTKIKNTKENKLATKTGVSYLNLIALGDNSNNLAQLLTSLIATHNCNISNSRITELGQDFAFSGLISGKWHEIIKLEKSLSVLPKKHSLHIYTKRNSTGTATINVIEDSPYINYTVQTTTIDKPGILNQLLQFFSRENIAVKEANIHPHHHNVHLINIEIQVKIPADRHIISLREIFLTYCDALNLDTSLELSN